MKLITETITTSINPIHNVQRVLELPDSDYVLPIIYGLTLYFVDAKFIDFESKLRYYPNHFLLSNVVLR